MKLDSLVYGHLAYGLCNIPTQLDPVSSVLAGT